MSRFFEKIPLPLRAFLFYLIQWTWGLPQNVLGALILPLLRGRRFRYHGALVTVYSDKRRAPALGAFSLGTFIFMPCTWTEEYRRHIVVHEYGHTVQSLILGPLYLLVIAIPSVIWSRRFGRRYAQYLARNVNYTDRFPENHADLLGEYATGEKAR